MRTNSTFTTHWQIQNTQSHSTCMLAHQLLLSLSAFPQKLFLEQKIQQLHVHFLKVACNSFNKTTSDWHGREGSLCWPHGGTKKLVLAVALWRKCFQRVPENGCKDWPRQCDAQSLHQREWVNLKKVLLLKCLRHAREQRRWCGDTATRSSNHPTLDTVLTNKSFQAGCPWGVIWGACVPLCVLSHAHAAGVKNIRLSLSWLSAYTCKSETLQVRYTS